MAFDAARKEKIIDPDLGRCPGLIYRCAGGAQICRS
jgi:hypothetical protein